MPIIFLTGHPDIRTKVRAMKAGAEDFLIKPVASDALLHAVARAVARHEVARDRRDRLEMDRARIARLSPREREVFELIIRGRTNKQAANALGTTERTVKAHRRQVMEKVQVRNVPELASLAERLGILGGTPDIRQTA